MTPSVRQNSSEILSLFAGWFKAGLGLGVMLFVACTTLSALGHSAFWIQGVVKHGSYVNPGPRRDLIIPKGSYVLPATVLRPAVVIKKDRDDYMMLREQNRFMTDMVGNLSRTMSRLAR